MIIYFTGTGNSKYIANLIAKQIDDIVIDSTQYIKAQEHPDFESKKPFVFVSPVYAWRMPRVFEKWIEQCNFNGNKKAYFVITCGGDIGASGNYTNKLSERINLEYMGTAEVLMPENYIIMLSVPKEEQIIETISSATEYTVGLCERIAAEGKLDEPKTNFLKRFCSDIINPMFNTFYIRANKFYTTDACISCGQCVENCVLNNIALEDGKPKWGNECTHCMACICKCPTEAIEYGKHTKGLRRYICPKTI